jgi:hypothetical protein
LCTYCDGGKYCDGYGLTAPRGLCAKGISVFLYSIQA